MKRKFSFENLSPMVEPKWDVCSGRFGGVSLLLVSPGTECAGSKHAILETGEEKCFPKPRKDESRLPAVREDVELCAVFGHVQDRARDARGIMET